MGKAQIFVDAAETLADETEIQAFAAEVDAYFARHDDPTTSVVRLTRPQLQRAAPWRAMKRSRKDQQRRQ